METEQMLAAIYEQLNNIESEINKVRRILVSDGKTYRADIGLEKVITTGGNLAYKYKGYLLVRVYTTETQKINRRARYNVTHAGVLVAVRCNHLTDAKAFVDSQIKDN